jgi:hypothetical protein
MVSHYYTVGDPRYDSTVAIRDLTTGYIIRRYVWRNGRYVVTYRAKE